MLLEIKLKKVLVQQKSEMSLFENNYIPGYVLDNFPWYEQDGLMTI